MKKIHYFCYFLVLFLISCKNDSVTPQNETYEDLVKKDTIKTETPPPVNLNLGLAKPFINPNLDLLLQARFWSELSEAGQAFQLDFSTVLDYTSGSYRIQREVIIKENEINIKFNKVPEIFFGDASIGPARTSVKINQLKEGIYTINLEMGDTLITQNLSKEKASQITDRVVRGKLVVDKQYYELVLPEQKLVTPTQNKVMRLPKNAVFGYFQYNEPMPNDMYEDFLERLKSIGIKSNRYSTGNYMYFWVNENGLVLSNFGTENPVITQHTRRQVTYYFAYEYEYWQDVTSLNSILKQYHQKYLDTDGVQRNIWIYIETARGQRLNSWAK